MRYSRIVQNSARSLRMRTARIATDSGIPPSPLPSPKYPKRGTQAFVPNIGAADQLEGRQSDLVSVICTHPILRSSNPASQ